MIAAQAAKNPDARVLTFADAHMTYAQLDQAANGLAHRLIELGVCPEVRVAVAMQRCADSLVAFLAVLKAGGAYVPLDVQYPADRLAYMLRDSQASLVLTRSEMVDALSIPALLPVLVLDENAAWRAFEGAAPCVP
ncbi:AMP-binding protein, partial [Pseudomonas viridiflava]|uniref:AMP-binding protein n=1 Tax=Pseudomonas viridiflava TaxID=33069 RepID=UPI0013CF0C83